MEMFLKMYIDTIVVLVGGLLALVIIETARLIYKRLNKQNIKVAWEIGFISFLLYLLLLVSITIFPLHINPYIDIQKHWAINIVPFFTTYKLIIAQESIYLEGYMRNFWITNIIGNHPVDGTM